MLCPGSLDAFFVGCFHTRRQTIPVWSCVGTYEPDEKTLNNLFPHESHSSAMKTKPYLLGLATACGLSLSSCVDPYGYPVAGGFAPGATYASVNYYDNTPYYGYDGYGYNNYGYGGYYPSTFTSVGLFGGGWGNGWGYNRACYPSRSHHHHHGHSSYRPSSSSHRYAAEVTRPSSFRGSSVTSRPPSMPSLPSPRTLSRPTSPRMSPAPSPSRSFSTPSLPRPSGRADRPSPLASYSSPSISRSAPSISRSAPSSSRSSFSSPSPSRSSFSAPSSSSSGRFGGGLPSDNRRSR